MLKKQLSILCSENFPFKDCLNKDRPGQYPKAPRKIKLPPHFLVIQLNKNYYNSKDLQYKQVYKKVWKSLNMLTNP